jgi:hypothetical protein
VITAPPPIAYPGTSAIKGLSKRISSPNSSTMPPTSGSSLSFGVFSKFSASRPLQKNLSFAEVRITPLISGFAFSSCKMAVSSFMFEPVKEFWSLV